MSQPSNPHLEGGWRKKVSTYDLDKEGTVKINGEYEMPMGLMDMDRFERLNNCQIIVFRLVKRNTPSTIFFTYSNPLLLFTPKLDIKFIFLFRFNDAELLPIRVSSRFTFSLVVDLLLLTVGSKFHYVFDK